MRGTRFARRVWAPLAGVLFTLSSGGLALAQQGTAIPASPPILTSPLPALGAPAPAPGSSSAPGVVVPAPGTSAPAPEAPAPAPSGSAQPSSSATSPPATSAPGAPSSAAPPAAPEAPAWLPRPVAELQILNKIDTTRTHLAIEVGKSATFATLTITVAACLVRPPGVQMDAAAYLTITDKDASLADFHGWLLAEEPGASAFEHPIYDVRLEGCSEPKVAPARR